ncbi:MAG: hypothetical protein ACREJQ_02055, partial [bacterium]
SALLFEEEKGLIEVFNSLREIHSRCFNSGARKLKDQLSQFVASITPDHIRRTDLFFDRVLVMDPDLEMRANRLALLVALDALFVPFGHLSKLVLPAA